MLTSRFEEALQLASELHRAQKRRTTQVPYIAHLMGVSALALEATAYHEPRDREDIAIGALLHDAIEDQGDKITLADVRERFGDHVHDIVLGCTDEVPDPTRQKRTSWRERKERFIATIGDKHRDVQLVCCADKLYNSRAIMIDHRKIGDKIWDRFSAKKTETLWYYESLASAFAASWQDNPLLAEFATEVAAMKRAVHG
jgi:(p)ppGpp synthase/HD superfamily hydrolase